MNRNVFWQQTAVLYALFLSGILFCGVPIDGDTFWTRILGMTLCFAGIWALYRFFPARTNRSCTVSPIFSLAALILCLGFACATLYSTASEMPTVSDTLSGGRFSHFFWILSLLLGLYITRDGFDSLARLCLPLLPLLLFPLVLTWFSLLNYEGALPTVAIPHDWAFRLSYFRDGVTVLGTVLLYRAFTAGEKRQIGEEKSERAAGTAAFFLFLFTFLAESAKYVLCFGANGAAALARPDRILLTLIPYINIQDIFLLVYYFSFMLRLSVAVASVRKYTADLSKNGGKIQKAVFNPLCTGAAVYAGFLLLCRFPVLYRFCLWTPLVLFVGKALLFSAGGMKKAKKTSKKAFLSEK